MKSASHKTLNHLLFISAICLSTTVFADDTEITDPIAHGKKLHNTHCLKCHSDSVYTRDNHRVRSLAALKKQVNMCKHQLDITWFDEDVDAVVQFLNKKYYRF